MAVRKLVGLGHSHLSCYQQAYRSGSRRGIYEGLDATFLRLNIENLQPNFELLSNSEALEATDRQLERDPRLRRLRDRLLRNAQISSPEPDGRSRVLSMPVERRIRHVIDRNKPDAVLLAAMGNEYNTFALLRHPRQFDFDYPGSGLPIAEDVERLPFGLVKAQMRRLAERNVLLFWHAVREAAEVPIYVVPPPPPIPSDLHILSYPGNFGEQAKKYGISPLPFRRKMWLLYCDVIREAVEAGLGRFVVPPDEIFVDGCLGKQFWRDDPTHANEQYGHVMLTHLCAHALGTEHRD